MSKQVFFLSHNVARQNAIKAIQDAPDGYVCEISEPKRSIPQNSFSHGVYADIARALPEDDALGWKSYCKLHHGVPILRAEDEAYRSFYDSAVKNTLSYEQKLAAMRFIPVTSLMGKKQKAKYMEAIKADFWSKGVDLQYPSDIPTKEYGL